MSPQVRFAEERPEQVRGDDQAHQRLQRQSGLQRGTGSAEILLQAAGRGGGVFACGDPGIVALQLQCSVPGSTAGEGGGWGVRMVG